MIKLLTQLNISVDEITTMGNPTNNQLVIDRSELIIKRYTGGWTNFKIYSVKELNNIITSTTNLHKSSLNSKVTAEKGKSLVDLDFANEDFKKLNGIEYGANFYEHPESDKHLSQQMITLFDTYSGRISDINRTKIASLNFDKSASIVDFKGYNNEILCSLLLKNVSLLENMMLTIVKIEELINKILLQDLPVINNLLNDYLNRLRSLKELFAEMYEKIKRAESQLGIEREPIELSDMVEKIIEKRTVNK